MRVLIFILLVTILTGCSAIDMQQYTANQPKLDLFHYFSGSTKGWGIVQDRKGVLSRQFVVAIEGEISEEGELVLVEKFDWSDGEKSSRTWVLSSQDDHNFVGTAKDVVGKASGVLYGNVLNWKYKLDLDVNGTTWEVSFDDWLFKVNEDLLINRAIMSKFGFKVGEVTIVFQKHEEND
jgi:hypothetical protein